MATRVGEVLAVRDFRTLTAVATLSQLGDRLSHMLLIAAIALARPGSLLSYSEGALVFSLPTLLLAPFVGVFVDRHDRRRVLAFTHLIQAGLLLATPLLTLLTGNLVPLWIAFFLFFALDLLNNTALPALVPAVVGENRILAANSVMLAFGRVATLAGMLAGGFLVGWIGWRLGLVANASTHLSAGLVALTLIGRRLTGHSRRTPGPATTVTRGRRFLNDLAETVRLVGRNRHVAFVLASIVVSSAISAVSYTVVIYLVQQVLGYGTAGVGILSAVLAVGMVGGALLMTALPRNVNRLLVVAAMVGVFGLLFLFGAWLLSLAYLVVIALLAGLAFSWLGIAQTTVLQESVEADTRARVFASREFVTNAVFLPLSFAVGTIGDLTSYRVVLPAVGGGLLLLAGAGAVFARQISAGTAR